MVTNFTRQTDRTQSVHHSMYVMFSRVEADHMPDCLRTFLLLEERTKTSRRSLTPDCGTSCHDSSNSFISRDARCLRPPQVSTKLASGAEASMVGHEMQMILRKQNLLCAQTETQLACVEISISKPFSQKFANSAIVQPHCL